MGRVGIAVEQLDVVFRPSHEGLVDVEEQNTPPIGMTPLVMPLAVVIMSGTTPK